MNMLPLVTVIFHSSSLYCFTEPLCINGYIDVGHMVTGKGARCSSVVRAFAHGAMGRRIDPPLSYFSFQPVLHDWCNKGCGMYYPVCGMMHIKEPLLLIGKSSLCGSSGFPLSLSEWSFTICLTPYNRKYNVLSVSLNKIFPSFFLPGYG